MKMLPDIKPVTRKANKGMILLSIALFTISTLAFADNKVDNTNSKVTFSGEHVGMKFSGVFEKWQASLVLPPAANPSINAIFELTSAKTGDFTYDSTLPEGDWFDTNNHPKGRFTSQSVELVENGYKVSGNLELRGVTKPQSFMLKQAGKTLTAQFTINRLDYGIGLDSDPDAEWVSRDIVMGLKLNIQ